MSAEDHLGRQFDDIIGRNFPDDRPTPTGDDVEDIVKQATYEERMANPAKHTTPDKDVIDLNDVDMKDKLSKYLGGSSIKKDSDVPKVTTPTKFLGNGSTFKVNSKDKYKTLLHAKRRMLGAIMGNKPKVKENYDLP
jgi:hypothetical protein